MQTKSKLATLPAWALVVTIAVLGAGWTAWCNICPDPSIDIDQRNAGNGNYRQNYAQAELERTGGWGWRAAPGGEIDIDQQNYGNGNYRDNVAYADVDTAGYGYHSGYGGGCCTDSSIDIDQGNYGPGNYRDNAAFATWSW